MHDSVVVAAATLAVVYVALRVAHVVGDHWVQTDGQACAKGGPGWAGQRAALMHVATLTLTKTAVLATVDVVLGLGLPTVATLAALALDAVSHYWADRRTTLAGLAAALGKADYYERGGAYPLDQAWHEAWLLVAALIIAAPASAAPWIGAGALLGLAAAAVVAHRHATPAG